MKDRKKHKQARRRGERLVRKRRAKKHDTLSTKLGEGRLIPGTEKPIPVKDIINKLPKPEKTVDLDPTAGKSRSPISDKAHNTTNKIKKELQS